VSSCHTNCVIFSERSKQQQAGIPQNELLKYMRDAACGLDALHAKGVQHRDVKPMNLLLMQGGVKVADFGLAKVLDHTAASHTGTMTVAYAPPEFFKGTMSQQSGQYSLAASYVHSCSSIQGESFVHDGWLPRSRG
jgi:serine/threonine protein kinase